MDKLAIDAKMVRYAETGLPYTQDSGTLAYLLELSPIFASCHHRFCIEDFPSPNPSRFKPRPYRGISIKNRDKTNTTWPTKNSSHNESNPHLSAL